jgi:Holliday junction resolvase RusA-like endonuclease
MQTLSKMDTDVKSAKAVHNLNGNREIVPKVSFTVPITPPSVNHYKQPYEYRTRTGTRKGFRITEEAKAWKQWVALLTRGVTIAPPSLSERNAVRYCLTVTIYLGHGQRGDGDNFWKCLADSLQEAGVIHSDARVRRWVLDVEDCDRENQRTEITAERIERRTI